MLLLLQEPHLTTLFDLLEMLASFKPPSGKVAVGDSEVTLALLSYRVCLPSEILRNNFLIFEQ